MKIFSCKIAQAGYFAGSVCFVKAAAAGVESEKRSVMEETAKYENAKEQLLLQLDDNKLSGVGSDIQETIPAVLNDELFDGGIREYINKQECSAACAIRSVAENICNEFNKIDDEYVRARAEDVKSIANELEAIINETKAELRERSALCAYELGPAQLSSIDAGLIGAIITEKGTPISHMAILAQSWGIPYLYGSKELIKELENAEFVIVDGEKGTVTVNPSDSEKKIAKEKQEQILRILALEAEAAAGDVCCKTKVYANIAGIDELSEVLKSGADGIGLFRTELLFIKSSQMPTEEEQFKVYSEILKAMGDKAVTIRAMDIGSDKKPEWMKFPKETNPALGLRGIRVLLENEELFNVQMRALLRAAVLGNLKIMFPMIASEWEIDAIVEKLQLIAAKLEKEGVSYRIPDIGVMIETPAAALIADELAKKVSFFSIGTNDLFQYALALDRESKSLDRYLQPYHEAVFRMIKITAAGGRNEKIKTGVCGQLAADPNAIERLIADGIEELSVPVKRVAAVKLMAAEAEAKLAAINAVSGTSKPNSFH